MATYLEQSLAKIKEFEGAIPWMYLDTVGKVTVGVGLMLTNEAAANALPFEVNGEPATAEVISSEFSRVSAMKKGLVAKSYSSKQGVTLSEETIDAKLRDTLEGFEGYLRSHLDGYDALPDAAKLALLDMVYNLGPGRLFAEYSHLIAAIERGDWKSAAQASMRRGPSAARNEWVKEQFLAAAARVDLKAEAESPSGSVLVGLICGLAAVVAAVILSGELDRLASRIRQRNEH